MTGIETPRPSKYCTMRSLFGAAAGKSKGRPFPFNAFVRGLGVRRAFLTQQTHCVHKPNALDIDQVIQRRLAADAPAFPVPDTAFAVDLKAVVAAQFKFTAGAAFYKVVRAVAAQEFYRRHALGGGDLLFRNAVHITKSRSAAGRPCPRAPHGKSSRPKCPPTAVRA